MKTDNRFYFILTIAALIFSTRVQPAFAKLVINEFSSSGSSDWIEIYNDSEQHEPLSGYKLRDNTTSNSLELNGILAPKGHVFFNWGNNLNKDGDSIRLVAIEDDTRELDRITYGNVTDKLIDAPLENQFAARTSDGGSSWALYTTATKGESNTGANPAPTATPTPTEMPKPTPTLTKTPTPTKSPTSSPTSTPSQESGVLGTSTALKKPTPTIDYHVPTAVLAQRTKRETPAVTPPAVAPEVRTKGIAAVNPSVIFIGLGTLFLMACLGFGYHAYRNGNL